MFFSLVTDSLLSSITLLRYPCTFGHLKDLYATFVGIFTPFLYHQFLFRKREKVFCLRKSVRFSLVNLKKNKTLNSKAVLKKGRLATTRTIFFKNFNNKFHFCAENGLEPLSRGHEPLELSNYSIPRGGYRPFGPLAMAFIVVKAA